MGWPNAHTLSPSTYDTVPIAPKPMSPLEYPTATAEPGRSVCTGDDPSGPAGAASTVRPAFAAAASSCWATGELSPLTVNGATIGRALASAARIRAESVALVAAADGLPGTPTGVARIHSIGVASASLPPYAFTDSEIAPITRLTPAPSGQ